MATPSKTSSMFVMTRSKANAKFKRLSKLRKVSFTAKLKKLKENWEKVTGLRLQVKLSGNNCENRLLETYTWCEGNVSHCQTCFVLWLWRKFKTKMWKKCKNQQTGHIKASTWFANILQWTTCQTSFEEPRCDNSTIITLWIHIISRCGLLDRIPMKGQILSTFSNTSGRCKL